MYPSTRVLTPRVAQQVLYRCSSSTGWITDASHSQLRPKKKLVRRSHRKTARKLTRHAEIDDSPSMGGNRLRASSVAAFVRVLVRREIARS
jgi:hypothetical protein